MSALRVFISYSSKDRALKDQVVTHLTALQGFGVIECWTDDVIRPGDDWKHKLQEAMETSDIALLLVSSSFLASNFVMDVEVTTFFQKHKEGRIRVIPVLLQSCAWQEHAWLASLGPLPRDGKPIASHKGDRRHQALTDIATEIARLAKERPVEAGLSPPHRQTKTVRLGPEEIAKLHAQAEQQKRDEETAKEPSPSLPTPEEQPGNREATSQPSPSPSRTEPNAPASPPYIPRPREKDVTRQKTFIYTAPPAPSTPPSESCIVVLWSPDENQRGTRKTVKSSGLTIGRDTELELPLADPALSFFHCRIITRKNQVILLDNKSSNGTYVNDVPIKDERVLSGGEKITIGTTILKYLNGTDTEAHFHRIVGELSTTDHVTGVFNARHMRGELEQIAGRAEQRGEPLALLALSIDHIRKVENSYGDDAIDAVLVTVVRRLKSVIPQANIGRDGEAGFLIALPNMQLEHGIEIARRLVEVTNDPVRIREHSIPITISVGVAELSERATVQEAVKLARERRYAAERDGGNQVASHAAAHRIEDAEWMLRKMVTMDSAGSVAAFEIEDEISLLLSLGPPLRRQWFGQLIKDVEHVLRATDIIATWQDRYVLAGLVERSADEAVSVVDAVRERWTQRAVPQRPGNVAIRALRSAVLGPDDLERYKDAPLDEILARLVRRADAGAEQEVANLPFPLAVTPVLVRTRPTASARLHSLLFGIDVVLRFAVAVELPLLLALDDRTTLEQAGRALAPYLGRKLRLKEWLEISLQLSRLCQGASMVSLSCVPSLFIDAQGDVSPLGAKICEAVERFSTKYEDSKPSEPLSDSSEAELLALFDDIWAAVRPLSACKLIAIERPDQFEDDEGKVCTYLFRELRGSSEDFPQKKARLPVGLIAGWCQLVMADNPPLPLVPLFAARSCSTCSRIEVFVADEISVGPVGAAIKARGVTSDHEQILRIPRNSRLGRLYKTAATFMRTP